MSDRYTQGIAFDGSAILKDGVPITIEEIVATLNGVAQAQAGDGGAVYTYRRKGLDYFCTCDESRYLELAEKSNFEVAIFYTRPQPAVNRQDLIELLISTRAQSEGVTADLIIKLLGAKPQVNRQLLELLQRFVENKAVREELPHTCEMADEAITASQENKL